MKTFIWSLSQDDGAILSIRATEKEIRADRRWWRKQGMRDLETKKVHFKMNRVGVADLLNRYRSQS